MAVRVFDHFFRSDMTVSMILLSLHMKGTVCSLQTKPDNTKIQHVFFSSARAHVYIISNIFFIIWTFEYLTKFYLLYIYGQDNSMHILQYMNIVHVSPRADLRNINS